MDYILQLRMKKRDNEISFNEKMIKKMESGMKNANDQQKKLLQVRITNLKRNNENLKRKNRNFGW